MFVDFFFHPYVTKILISTSMCQSLEWPCMFSEKTHIIRHVRTKLFHNKTRQKNLCAFTPTNQRDSAVYMYYNHWQTSKDLCLLYHLSKLSKFNSQILVRLGSSAKTSHIHVVNKISVLVRTISVYAC